MAKHAHAGCTRRPPGLAMFDGWPLLARPSGVLGAECAAVLAATICELWAVDTYAGQCKGGCVVAVAAGWGGRGRSSHERAAVSG